MPLGPVEIEVIRNALTAAAAEMDVTVWRTSRSTIVRELLDYSTAVFDAEGNNLAQSARIPSHLNSMSHLLRELLDRHVDPAGWGPEDVVVTNDPYCGGQHLPDIVAFKPVLHEGRRIAFVGTLCHHIDVGGLAAGSYAAKAIEIYQEGLRIPPVKLIEDGAWRDVPVWDRDALPPEVRIAGPAILEEPFATHWIGRGWTAAPGPAGALIAVRTTP